MQHDPLRGHHLHLHHRHFAAQETFTTRTLFVADLEGLLTVLAVTYLRSTALLATVLAVATRNRSSDRGTAPPPRSFWTVTGPCGDAGLG